MRASKGLRRGNTWGNTPFHVLNPDALNAKTTIHPAVCVIGAVCRMLISAIFAMTWSRRMSLCRAALSAALTAVQSSDGEEPWRERPRFVARRAARPLVKGSVTPRFPVPSIVSAARPRLGQFVALRTS